MDFSAISSLNNYIKGMQMQTLWEQRKSNNDFTSKSYTEQWIEEQRKQAFGIPGTKQHNDNTQMQNIHTKLSSGKELSHDELEYLRKNDPVTYQKVKSAEAEREAYERKLRQCKTKEDVDRLQFRYTAASLSSISSVKNNSEMTQGDKYAIMMVEQQKMDAIASVTVKFMQSTQYSDLPTDEESRRAQQLIEDSEWSEYEPYVGYQKPEITDISDQTFEEEQEITPEEAENDPVVKKDKRARIHAAYADNMLYRDSIGTDLGEKINVTI